MRVAMHAATSRPGHTGYVDLLMSAPQNRFACVPWSWKRLMLRPPSIVHLHWPENLIHSGTSLGQILKGALLLAGIWLAKIRGARVVRTVHNIEPHETPDFYTRFIIRCIDRQVDGYVKLNEHTRLPRPEAGCVVIPHPLYPPEAGATDPSRGPIHFGKIRDYKGIPSLVSAFEGSKTRSAGYMLRIIGKPDPRAAGLSHQLEKLSFIESDLRDVPDQFLRSEIAQHPLTILPFAKPHNSGALFLSLSCGTPVLIKRNGVTEDLQAEFGADSVFLYDGEITSHAIDSAMTIVLAGKSCQASPPRPPSRESTVVWAAHEQFYLGLLAGDFLPCSRGTRNLVQGR